ncbi:MAG: hypothetical protein K0Q95_2955 [Bacteroidota bacterium]|jgi:hypothetical protein|nr:hypothetical protein [Bacteroidota bacterium]
MKQLLALIIFSSVTTVFSQSGTIKVAKPKPVPKKDTAAIVNVIQVWSYKPFIASNYSFKDNNKLGYEAGISFNRSVNKSLAGAWFGLSYCAEQQFFELSSYDKQKQEKAAPFSQSQNKSEYLKLSMGVGEMLNLLGGRRRGDLYIELGIVPKYLLKTSNEYNRLFYSDFRKYNIAGKVNFGFFIKRRLLFEMIYSHDFLENLKDRNIYDQTGAYIGKQHSKTKLLSFSASYIF